MMALPQAAQAGPMPVLPELPPLPTDYASAGFHNGSYVGVVGGIVEGQGVPAAVGLLAGTTFLSGDEVNFGLEALALMQGSGLSVDLAARVGVPLGDQLALFGHAGLGLKVEDGLFATLGGGLEYAATETLTWRAQYRYEHDLSGDASGHGVLFGALIGF
jgi:opacity protein-like surface antigen